MRHIFSIVFEFFSLSLFFPLNCVCFFFRLFVQSYFSRLCRDFDDCLIFDISKIATTATLLFSHLRISLGISLMDLHLQEFRVSFRYSSFFCFCFDIFRWCCIDTYKGVAIEFKEGTQKVTAEMLGNIHICVCP